jgi:uncharacterized membrane protein YgaE (UPF0421/DUF939 family)
MSTEREVAAGATQRVEENQEEAPLPLAVPNHEGQPIHARLLSDSFVFHWNEGTFKVDLLFVVPVAVCLAIGLLAGNAAAGMIAAGGAMTTGFGAKQRIDQSRLLPMIFCALGIAFSTFVGMVAGHEGVGLVLIASAFGFGYGMLSARAAGYGWVGQQCVVTLLVASAFPFSVGDAALRSALIFAGGILQVLSSAALLQLFEELAGNVRALTRYLQEEEQALLHTYRLALRRLRSGALHDSPVPYATRLAVVLALSTELYRALHFASGYWIPMTALLVLRPGLSDTASRAIARTVGTLAGAVLASTCLAYTHPAPVALACFTVVFAWLAYSTLNINYALFSVCLTSYIVMLLSLTSIPGTEIARRRTICTVLGGAMALSVRLVVLESRARSARRSQAALDAEPPMMPERRAHERGHSGM